MWTLLVWGFYASCVFGLFVGTMEFWGNRGAQKAQLKAIRAANNAHNAAVAAAGGIENYQRYRFNPDEHPYHAKALAISRAEAGSLGSSQDLGPS